MWHIIRFNSLKVIFKNVNIQFFEDFSDTLLIFCHMFHKILSKWNWLNKFNLLWIFYGSIFLYEYFFFIRILNILSLLGQSPHIITKFQHYNSATIAQQNKKQTIVLHYKIFYFENIETIYSTNNMFILQIIRIKRYKTTWKYTRLYTYKPIWSIIYRSNCFFRLKSPV